MSDDDPGAEATTKEREADSAAENAEDQADLVEKAEQLLAIADEIEDVLGTVDLDDAIGSLDADGVDLENLPEAVDEGDPSEVVDPLELVDLPEALDAADVREFWRQARELEEAVDDFSDDESPDDDGFGVGDAFDTEDTFDADVSLGMDDTDVPNEGVQAAVQSELAAATDEFRKGLMATQKHLKAMREANEERTGSVGQPSSRNPTAVSTMSQSGPTGAKTVPYSTVPEETRYSNAPNRERVYGNRFPDAEDDDE